MSDTIFFVRQLLQRPVAFHPVLAHISGSVNAGLFLSQLLYWQDKGNDQEGWIYKTYDEWMQETAMGRYELDGARKRLKESGLVEEKRKGCPARLYYRINFNGIICAIHKLELEKPASQSWENQQTRVGKTSKLELGKPASYLYTENTSEITSESTSIEAARVRTSDKLDVFVECYNQHKPASFASLTVVNPERRKKLEKLIRDCGGVDNALVALTNALRYANADEWYRGKDLSFDNFASNGKILQLHERWVERESIGAPLGASNSDVEKARMIAEFTAALS